jgi:Ca2+-binding EF-hand superfamily protein
LRPCNNHIPFSLLYGVSWKFQQFQYFKTNFCSLFRERDKDNDGKLNFQEFYNGLFYSIRHFDEEASTDDSNASDAPARKSFTHLDLDNDGLLSADELKPIIGNLHPPEHFYAKQQADYVITQADTNKDGQLSLQEMIENPYVFYSALFTEDDYGFHDELR